MSKKEKVDRDILIQRMKQGASVISRLRAERDFYRDRAERLAEEKEHESAANN